MAAISSAQWKATQIAKAESITDALEVALAYAARLSEWIILLCILFSVSEALPGIHFPLMVSNGVLWLQIITLDVAGLSLMALEKNARANGNIQAANTARVMMYTMISVTMITLFAVNVGNLFPTLSWLTTWIDFAMVFVRIGISLIFKFVIVNIRSSEVQVIPVKTHEDTIEKLMQNYEQKSQENTAFLLGKIDRLTLVLEQQNEVKTDPVLEAVLPDENESQNDGKNTGYKKPSGQTTSRRTMTIEQAINTTNLTERQVKNLIKKGTFKVSSRNKNLLLIASIEAWQKTQKTDAESVMD